MNCPVSKLFSSKMVLTEEDDVALSVCILISIACSIQLRRQNRRPCRFWTKACIRRRSKYGLFFGKYPNKMEKFVHRVDTIEHKIDEPKGEKYYRRMAHCSNVVPQILRAINILNEKAILLEEEAWLNSKKRMLRIKSRNVTWAKYANMWEHSVFTPSKDNPNWTRFEQHGVIDIKGIGPFGRVIEMFAESFLRAGARRALNIMETLLNERSQTETPVR